MLSAEDVMQLIQSLIWLLAGLERVADHIVNVGYSICNPTGDDDDNI